MYESFFGLRERPFDLTPNPRFIYLSGCHLEALSVVHYGIVGRKGITLVVGEAGTGKTTVIRTALEAIAQPTARCVYLSNPTLDPRRVLRVPRRQFRADRGGRRARRRGSCWSSSSCCVQRNKVKDLTALVIDEAQSLSIELMEEVRLLANLETLTDKLLPVVMAGQPELAEMLDRPELRQLKQRVALRADLSPLGLRQVAAYVAGRIRKAGGDPLDVFTKEAIVLIHAVRRHPADDQRRVRQRDARRRSRPGVKPIGPDIVEEVARDFRLSGAGGRGRGGNGSGRRGR